MSYRLASFRLATFGALALLSACGSGDQGAGISGAGGTRRVSLRVVVIAVADDRSPHEDTAERVLPEVERSEFGQNIRLFIG